MTCPLGTTLRVVKKKVAVWCLTSEQQPERSSSNLAFDEIQSLVRRFFVHSKRHRDVRRLTKRSMLGSIMTFTEVIDAIAEKIRVSFHADRKRGQRSQVTNYHMHRRRWVIGCDRDVTTGFVTGLRKFTHRVSTHGEIRPWQLNQGRGHGRHDQCEEERITFLPVRMEICHV